MRPRSKEISVRSRNLLALAAAGVLAVGAAACGSSSSSSTSSSSGKKVGGTISGAGATFPQPVYDEWGNRFNSQTGTTVNYNPIGSGGGIAQFTAGTVALGAPHPAPEEGGGAAGRKKRRPARAPRALGPSPAARQPVRVRHGPT